MFKFFNYVIERLREPSTYAGLAGVLAALHVNLDPGLWQMIIDAAIAMAGIAAFFVREHKA
ncbi:MAG: hypothetical protein HOO00_02030 [Rhodospirillaceae bacterium]|jgi:hypothetical protein|nr:hypothetical protein [Rhodospirillaceae bacterium]MBT5373855.1 hypothetical protein [Rhodospirillaceae bacterium]MBT5752851.1 hypothetical protein [Rhodospirillaceae bacterium]